MNLNMYFFLFKKVWISVFEKSKMPLIIFLIPKPKTQNPFSSSVVHSAASCLKTPYIRSILLWSVFLSYFSVLFRLGFLFHLLSFTFLFFLFLFIKFPSSSSASFHAVLLRVKTPLFINMLCVNIAFEKKKKIDLKCGSCEVFCFIAFVSPVCSGSWNFSYLCLLC